MSEMYIHVNILLKVYQKVVSATRFDTYMCMCVSYFALSPLLVLKGCYGPADASFACAKGKQS